MSLVAQCDLLGLSRSTWYERASEPSPLNGELMRRLDEEYTAHPFYGSRRMTAVLRRAGYAVNRKRVLRLMRQMGLAAIYPKPALSHPDPDHRLYPYLLRGVTATGPDHVWSTEIVFTQMTKTDVLAARVGRDDITNFDLGIRHDNPVDQKLDQLTLLFEGGIDQPPLNAGAELLNGDGQSGHFLVAFGLGRELGLLFRQRLVTLRQVAAAPLILGQGDDGLQVGFR